jgi:hypothetical protein
MNWRSDDIPLIRALQAVEDRSLAASRGQPGRPRDEWKKHLIDMVLLSLRRSGVPISASRTGALALVIECLLSAAGFENDNYEHIRTAVAEAKQRGR